MSKKRVAFHHFGCKVNFSEASSLSRQLQDKGYEIRDFHEQADVYVISSCVVTAVAEKKCRAAIRQVHRLNPEAHIAVIGCFSELKPGEIGMMDGVDLVLGHQAKFNLPEELEKLESGKHDHPEYHGGIQPSVRARDEGFVPSFSYGDRTRSFLKIQDGCDYYCSYCTIPLARGHSRSDTIENVVRNAHLIADQGVREIVLTGVNIGDFGRGKGENFSMLVDALNAVDRVERIRISSIEPDLLSDEIIDKVAGSRNFLPHFHIPLQSGHNRVLKAMHRKYTRELFASRVERIRERMPYACIAADVIAGFPGETDEEFEDAAGFIRSLPISYLHVFTYSKRENTLASKMESIVPERIRKERSDLLHRISEEKKEAFYKANDGRMVNVLFESENNNGFMYGFSENYIRVRHLFTPAYINEVVNIRLENYADGYFQA